MAPDPKAPPKGWTEVWPPLWYPLVDGASKPEAEQLNSLVREITKIRGTVVRLCGIAVFLTIAAMFLAFIAIGANL